jgi:hypothetical protein
MSSSSDTSGGSTSSSSHDTGSAPATSSVDASSASSAVSDDLESGSRKSAHSARTGSGASFSDGEKSPSAPRTRSRKVSAQCGVDRVFDLVFVWLGVLLGSGALVLFVFVHLRVNREKSVSTEVFVCDSNLRVCGRCKVEEEFPVSLIVVASIASFCLLAAGPTLTVMKIRGTGGVAGFLIGLGALAGGAVALLTYFFVAAATDISCDDPEGMGCLSSSQKEAYTNWCIKNKNDGSIGLGLMWASFVASCAAQVIFFYSKDVAEGDPEAPSADVSASDSDDEEFVAKRAAVALAREGNPHEDEGSRESDRTKSREKLSSGTGGTGTSSAASEDDESTETSS